MKIAWFSCGITSAVACKMALQQYDDVEIYYISIESAHADNKRFISECEQWYGQEIRQVSSLHKDQYAVIDKKRFINSPFGAPCTKALKKEVRQHLHEQLKPDAHIMGYEYAKKEFNRAMRFREQYPETNALFPLLEKQLNKNECASILLKAGINIPEMYKLGFANNNCIGCVKGGQTYWAKIRKHFPIQFLEMAKRERQLNHSCIRKEGKPLFLDNLPNDIDTSKMEVMPDCGLFCEVEMANILHPDTKKAFTTL